MCGKFGLQLQLLYVLPVASCETYILLMANQAWCMSSLETSTLNAVFWFSHLFIIYSTLTSCRQCTVKMNSCWLYISLLLVCCKVQVLLYIKLATMLKLSLLSGLAAKPSGLCDLETWRHEVTARGYSSWGQLGHYLKTWGLTLNYVDPIGLGV